MPPPSSSAWPASTSRAARIAGSAVGAPSSYCPPLATHSKTATFSAGDRRDPPPRHHRPSRCRSPTTSAALASSCGAQPHRATSPLGRAAPVVTPLAAPTPTDQLPKPPRLPAWASQNTRLNLTFPDSTPSPPARGGSVQRGLSGACNTGALPGLGAGPDKRLFLCVSNTSLPCRH